MLKKLSCVVWCVVLLFGVSTFGAAAQNDTLIYGKGHSAITLDPGQIDEGGSSHVVIQIVETLVEFKPGTTEVVPGLAESYEISEDGKEITFHLRKGVKFHDGTEMDADAVVFSLARQHYKDHPYHDYGPWKQWTSNGWSDTYNEDGSLKSPGVIKDILKVDDYTVKVTLNEPDASIMVSFSAYYAGIISPTAFKKDPENFKKHPVATGPFQFTKWVKDDYVAVERFDEYWREPAKLKRVIFKVYPDATARSMALKKGEVDIIDPPDYDNLLELMKEPNVKVLKQEGLTVGYVCMFVKRAPFDNKLARQAMNYAVNKEEIIKAVYGELGTPSKVPIPKLLWGYNEEIEPYSYDPEKAKELLAEAGYGDGFEIELFALPVSRPYNPNGRKVAEIMQAQLKQVGVDAKIVSYDIGTYWDKVDAGEFDMAMTGWTGGADPNNYLFKLFTEGYLNSSQWINEEYIDLVTRAKQVMDREERANLYKEAQVILHEEAPIIPLANGVLVYPMLKRVQGFVMYPTDEWLFKTVSLADE